MKFHHISNNIVHSQIRVTLSSTYWVFVFSNHSPGRQFSFTGLGLQFVFTGPKR